MVVFPILAAVEQTAWSLCSPLCQDLFVVVAVIITLALLCSFLIYVSHPATQGAARKVWVLWLQVISAVISVVKSDIFCIRKSQCGSEGMTRPCAHHAGTPQQHGSAAFSPGIPCSSGIISKRIVLCTLAGSSRFTLTAPGKEKSAWLVWPGRGNYRSTHM